MSQKSSFCIKTQVRQSTCHAKSCRCFSVEIICLWKFFQAVCMQDMPCEATHGQTDGSAVKCLAVLDHVVSTTKQHIHVHAPSQCPWPVGTPVQQSNCTSTSGPIHQALVHARARHSQPPAGLFQAVPLAQSASLVFSDWFVRSDSLGQKAGGASACLEPLHICPLASMVPASKISELAYAEGSLLDSSSYVCWAHQAFSYHEY